MCLGSSMHHKILLDFAAGFTCRSTVKEYLTRKSERALSANRGSFALFGIKFSLETCDLQIYAVNGKCAILSAVIVYLNERTDPVR